MYGKDFKYAESRLQGSIVRLGAEPVIVERVGDSGRTAIRSLLTKEIEEVPLDDLNLEPVSLGYVSIEGKCSYLMRRPMRSDWRQGIRHATLTSHKGQHMVPDAAFRKVVIGEYPSLEEAIDGLQYGRETAFHRRWACVSTDKLAYMGKVVGTVRAGVLSLLPKYLYLQEVLDRDVNN